MASVNYSVGITLKGGISGSNYAQTVSIVSQAVDRFVYSVYSGLNPCSASYIAMPYN
jgi:hypothetical protein